MSIYFIAYLCFVVDFLVRIGGYRYRQGWSLVVSAVIVAIVTLVQIANIL